MKAVRTSVVVGDGRLPGVDVVMGVIVVAWVIEPVKDFEIKGLLVVRNAVNLEIGGVTDFLASYDYQFLVGDEPVHYRCGA